MSPNPNTRSAAYLKWGASTGGPTHQNPVPTSNQFSHYIETMKSIDPRKNTGNTDVKKSFETKSNFNSDK